MDDFFGAIRLFPYNYAPVDWLPCDGRTLAVTNYQALYALIGNNYGGTPGVSFVLPKLAPVPVLNNGPALNYYICMWGIWPLR